ncbi:MAG: TlpA family protein disulfide reductase [Acidobacteria bacterium]|nr:TlpA family protein disulfide reductase [Acidobacteriota bacterium]
MTVRFAALALAALSLGGADIPRTAPDFQVRMTDGKDILLSSYKGKVVAIEFILTDCGHCQKASQTLNKLHRELGPQGFQPVAVAINNMANMFVNDFVKQFNITYPVGFSPREPVLSFLQHDVMMSLMMPQLVIIDRKGVVRYQYAGNDRFFENEEKNLREILIPLIKTGAAAPAKPAAKK